MTEKKSELYALLIGIDCYLPNLMPDGGNYPCLSGCVRDVAHRLSFDKSAHLVVDLSATKAIFSGIQADLFFTPQISFADSSNSQSVMPACALQGACAL